MQKLNTYLCESLKLWNRNRFLAVKYAQVYADCALEIARILFNVSYHDAWLKVMYQGLIKR